jgi:hypothetical protein
MTIPEKVVAFLLGGKPGVFCDDCISSGLNLPRRQEVAIVTLTLSLCSGFQRAQGLARPRSMMECRKSWLLEPCRVQSFKEGIWQSHRDCKSE